MQRNSLLKYVIYGIVGLAAIGLIMQLLTNTAGLLLNILITAVFALAIFGLIYYFILGGRNTSSDTKKYKQAVRQSKSKYTHSRPNTIKSSQQYQAHPIKKKNKKRSSHLRVIDGNKSKRKKRVSN